MKTVLNIVTTILVILFFGWQFLGNCCEKECDYTKCDKSEIKEECPHANLDEANVNVEVNIDGEDTTITVDVQIEDSTSVEEIDTTIITE
jgi:hypothetical protein